MPVAYSAGILAEHRAVRSSVGVFDISHMGQFVLSGSSGRDWLDGIFSNNLRTKLSTGRSIYGFLLNERGGVIDDLIVYETAPDQFLLVVNAAKADEDWKWLSSHLPKSGDAFHGNVTLENRSPEYAALAIQGPKATDLTAKFFGKKDPASELPSGHGALGVLHWKNIPILVSRTGYTGEEGFEWFFPKTHAEQIWDALLAEGQLYGLLPCGLGARDTLRLEVCYPLNGSDLSPDLTPLEAGLGIFVDLKNPDKGNFIGRAALEEQKAVGVKQKLVAFRFQEKSPPPRAHYAVFHNGTQVGETTSANQSPSMEIGIGMAYLPAEIANIGEIIEIDIRGRRYAATIEKKPLYKKPAS